MKTMYKIVILTGLLITGLACQEENTPTSEFEYTGPIPAIEEGPSEAQKICYELYQKYDLHVYYTLSGQEALQTDIGWTQTNMIEWTAPDALPMQAGDESTSEAFLKFMVKFYDLLPEKLVKSSVLRRNVLIKVKANEDYFSEFPSIGFTGEAQQGIAYWGDMDDEIGVQPDVWKYSLCFGYFSSQTYSPVSGLPKNEELGKISQGLYVYEQDDYYGAMEEIYNEEGELNMDVLMNWGFVDPVGFTSGDSKYNQYTDMATYATWIACIPFIDRQTVLDNYPLVKRKYDLTVQYYKTYLDLNLETFGEALSKITFE